MFVVISKLDLVIFNPCLYQKAQATNLCFIIIEMIINLSWHANVINSGSFHSSFYLYLHFFWACTQMSNSSVLLISECFNT